MRSNTKKQLLFLLVLFLFALGLRLIYLNQLQDSLLFDTPIMDAKYHDQWAMAIRDGQPFHEGPYFRAPGYAYFLAAIYALFSHQYMAARMVQFIIGSFSVLLIYFLGKRAFNHSVGVIAAVLASIYGGFIYFEGELLIPALIIFADLALVLALLSTSERPGWWKWFGCGAILGLSSITRPNILLFGIILLPWIVLRLRRRGLGGNRVFLQLAGFALGTLLIILPVTTRNYLVGRDFVPIASQGGVNFFIGNNQKSDGSTAIVPGTAVSWWGGYWEAIRLAENAEGRSLSASEVSNYWFKQGLEFMRENPKGYLRLFLRKLALFWDGVEISNNKDIYFFSKRTPPLGILLCHGVIFCPFGIVAPLALAGMVLSWRRGQGKRKLLILFVFSYMVSVILFFVTARFRLVVIPFLLPFAGYSLVYLFREKRLARILFAVVLILVFGLAINLNLADYSLPPVEGSYATMGHAYLEKKMYHQAEEEFRLALSTGFDHKGITAAKLNSITGLAKVYEETGNLDGAIGLLEQAILMRPNMVTYPIRAGPDMETLYYHLGCFYYAGGRLDDAISQWEETIRLWPALPEPYIQLSKAYEDKGRAAEAIALLERAIQVDQQNFLAHYNLANLYAKQARVDEAVDHYKKTIEIVPAFVDAYASLAWIYSQTGTHLDEGIQLVKKGLELDESSRASWVTLAELYIQKGETEKARDIFRKMIQKEPEEAYWRRRLKEIEN